MGQTTLNDINLELYPSWIEDVNRSGQKIYTPIDIDIPQLFTLRAKSWDRVCILNSNYPTAHKVEMSIGAFGAKDEIICKTDRGSFDQLAAFLDLHVDEWKFGYFSYDLKNDIEDLHSENIDTIGFPTLHFFVPKEILISYDGQLKYIGEDLHAFEEWLKNVQDPSNAQVGESLSADQLQSFPEEEDYIEIIKELQEEIAVGNIYEINFCRDLRGSGDLDPYATNVLLNRQSPAPFSSFYKLNEHFLIGASPERFIEKNAQELRVQPMKGTKRRVQDEKEDEEIKRNLASDVKEQAENVMIVDLMRNDLSKTAVRGSVNVEELFGAYTFPYVHQLISSITSELKSEVSYLEAIRASFPMGSMTGAPKLRAMKLIEKHEQFKRGLFSGSVGMITPSGNLDFNVVIRSILYNDNSKNISIPTGSAITAQSIAEKEWEECQVKSESLISCLQISKHD